MKAFIMKHKKILLCLLIVLLLIATVYTVCSINEWRVKMSELPKPVLWLYLRTNGYKLTYASVDRHRSLIAHIEEDVHNYRKVLIPKINILDIIKGRVGIDEVVARYYGRQHDRSLVYD